MNRYLLFTLLFLLGCSSAGTITSPSGSDKEPVQEKLTFSDKVYFLQHRLIRDWVFETDGEFFFDIYNHELAHLIDTTAEVVSPEYAEGLSVKPLVGKDAVLILFPTPETPPHCYYALITKEGDNYHYYTYEKSLDLWGDEVIGALGGWSREGDHMNYGPRSYKTSEAFVQDVLERK